MKPKAFRRYDDPEIVSILSQGDQFKGFRSMKDGSINETLYTISFNPVYFKYSGNWTLRCHHRGLNHLIGLRPEENLCEYIYVNSKCMDKYLWQVGHIAFFERHKQLTQLTESMKPKPITLG